MWAVVWAVVDGRGWVLEVLGSTGGGPRGQVDSWQVI